MSNSTTKNRSYEVRRRIAEIIGAAPHGDFTTEIRVRVEHPQSGDCDVTEGTLLATSNVGFEGITGYFELDGFTRPTTRSLGLVIAVDNAGTWETL